MLDFNTYLCLQDEVESQFGNGDRFFDLPDSFKTPTTFDPDLFAGWRSLKDTERAVGEVYVLKVV